MKEDELTKTVVDALKLNTELMYQNNLILNRVLDYFISRENGEPNRPQGEN